MELIKDNLPCSRWKVGKIVDLFVGRDQRIRSAKVFASPHSYLHQPLSLLYPIECPNEGIDDVGKGNQSTAQSTESTEENKEEVDNVPNDGNEEAEGSTTHDVDDLIPLVSSTRPMRKATVAARKKIKEWLNPEESMFVWGSVADCEKKKRIM